jgi:hypothetical protein
VEDVAELAIGKLPSRIYRDPHDHVVVDFGMMNQYFFEPRCAICHQPIYWMLHMQSFIRTDGGLFVMAHAWCAWTPHAFKKAKKRSKKFEKRRQKLPE